MMTTTTPASDLLIHGGRVFTAAEALPWAEAFVIRADRSIAVGVFEDLAQRFPGSERLDVGGRTVVPGLIDAHNHFLATGESMASLEVGPDTAASIDEVVRRVAEAAALI